jgi:hypothetical protein
MLGRSKRSEASVIINFRHSGRASSIIVQRQRRWGQTGDLNNGGFLFHRNPKESEDELEIIHSTCAGASGKAGQHHSNRILTKFIRPACAHGSSPLLHNMRPEERHKTVTGPIRHFDPLGTDGGHSKTQATFRASGPIATDGSGQQRESAHQKMADGARGVFLD